MRWARLIRSTVIVARPAAVRPTKVSAPVLFPWVKERGYAPGLWVDAREVGTLVAVVKKTSQRQVFGTGGAFMTCRDNMVDLKSDCIVFLRHQTILAARLGPYPDLSFKAPLHEFTRRIRFPGPF